MPDEKLLTATQAAKVLGVTVATLRQWARSGKIQVIKLPSGRIRIPESVIHTILEGAM